MDRRIRVRLAAGVFAPFLRLWGLPAGRSAGVPPFLQFSARILPW